MTTPYTLTGASDWPMLVGLFKLMAWAFGGGIGVIIALIVGLWADFRRQYSTHCDNEKSDCQGCHGGIMRELEAVWDTIETCCPRSAQRPTRSRRKGDGADL